MGEDKKSLHDLLEQIAVQNGVSVEEVEREMRRTIDAAWDKPDPGAAESQRKLFPGGKPSIAEFIRVMAEQAKQ